MLTTAIPYFLGLPNYLKKIQTISNKCVRLIFSLPPRIPTTQESLHWLPVRACVEFKVCLIAYRAIMYKQPKYIVGTSCPAVETQSSLWSSNDPYRLHEPIHSQLMRELLPMPLLNFTRSCQLRQSSRHHCKVLRPTLKSICLPKHDIANNVLNESYRI